MNGLHKYVKFHRILMLDDLRCSYHHSHEVRDAFVDYFKSTGHSFIRSSPVVPWKDKSLAFVNAGMNQFKPVFLGHKERPCEQAVNSQKCIRVGGKHNDLASVGLDGSHHTFFEMLGSWSFGTYFKKEACELSWKFLTQILKISPNSLYVTYFGGCPHLNLPEDLEVLDAWRLVGVPPSRILPFGMQHNFWEMGALGPCGPCTEIHYDFRGRPDAADLINTGCSEVVELWNLVFIEYNRLPSDTLVPLNMKFVDTGMGLERLLSVLNGTSSNYDSDLFQPIFREIHKLSGQPEYGGRFGEDSLLDTSYRVLADHIRMITVALADGMLPRDSHKLHYVIKRALSVGWSVFNLKGAFLPHLSECVAVALGSSHPELVRNLARVQCILAHEEEEEAVAKERSIREWDAIIKKFPALDMLTPVSTASLVEAAKELMDLDHCERGLGGKVPPELLSKLSCTLLLPKDVIYKLCIALGRTVTPSEVDSAFESLDLNDYDAGVDDDSHEIEADPVYPGISVLQHLKKLSLPASEIDSRYSYSLGSNGTYVFDVLNSKILSIIKENNIVNSVKDGEAVSVILEKSNFYPRSGGQDCDIGTINGRNFSFEVKDVKNIGNYVVHGGSLAWGEMRIGDGVVAEFDEKRRFCCMQHHTATHLLSSMLNCIIGPTSQRSSSVRADGLSFEVHSLKPFTENVATQVGKSVKEWIENGSPVVHSTQKLEDVLTSRWLQLVPGEVYPDIVCTVCTSFRNVTSFEPCCGTHLHNTSHIGNFIITSIKSRGSKFCVELRAVCGELASQAEDLSQQLSVDLKEVKKEASKLDSTDADSNRYFIVQKKLRSWRQKLEGSILPYLIRQKLSASGLELSKKLEKHLQIMYKNKMLEEVTDMLHSAQTPAIVHILGFNFGNITPHFTRATKLCKDKPIMLIIKCGSNLNVQCVVPKHLVERGLSATKWMKVSLIDVSGRIFTPFQQNDALVSNFKGNPSPDVDRVGSQVKCNAEKYIMTFIL